MKHQSPQKRNAVLWIIFILFSLNGGHLHAQVTTRIPMSPSRFVGWVPGQIVLRLDDQLLAAVDKGTVKAGITGIDRLDQLGRQLKVSSLIRQFPRAKKRIYRGRMIDLGGWFKVRFSDSISVENACQLYASLPGILAAQPIGIHSVDVFPNDYSFSQQWHLNQADDHDVDSPEAWDLYTGQSDIIVGVMDSGVRYYHKDLGGANASYSNPQNARGNMWINSAESAVMNNGSDDDGNGYTDDWIGWDFVTGVSSGGGYLTIPGEDYDTPDNDPADFNGHGTHCSGNVSAITNNGYGTASVAGGWSNGTLQATGNGVRVMALRIGYSMTYQGQERGFVQMDFAAEALQYAADNGARIVSCSWSSSNSGGIGVAIDYFLASGGLIFKAAGNSNSSSADYICGRGDANVINVAATDSFDVRAGFSNYGDWVDVSAPGVYIWSSYHVHDDPQNDYSAAISGTSMATPVAASCAALIWSVNPGLTADVVRQILLNNADNIDGLNPGYEGLLGAGRVNAHTPLQDSSLPVELGSFTAYSDSGTVILDWETFSELENLGFKIYRQAGDDENYQLIASYLDQSTLQGTGNSSSGRRYRYVDREVTPGIIYSYLLYDVDYYGWETVHGPVHAEVKERNSIDNLYTSAVAAYQLYPNYPNPFNPTTTIEFQIPSSEFVTLRIYNVLGEEVASPVDEKLQAGTYRINFDGSRLASGVYLYKLQAGPFHQVRKMILIR